MIIIINHQSMMFGHMQVTQHEARLLDAQTGELVTTWHTDASLAKVVSDDEKLILASTGHGHLFLLQVSEGAISCVAEADLNAEVACIDLARWSTGPGAKNASLQLSALLIG